MRKLAIIGASYLQNPLILEAKRMGLETHVFAWAAGDIGETTADYFYPISITEKEEILKKCQEIGIDGICSIASDLAMVAVNYVADKMGLSGNSLACTLKSTNKFAMRNALSEKGVPCPKYVLADASVKLDSLDMEYPIIVKPTDRSGSRGVTKLMNKSGLMAAVSSARDVGFEKKAIVEEFIEGKEYSVECISFNGQHKLLAVTEKFTTGSPNFIETGHFEPAPIDDAGYDHVREVVFRALDALEIRNGASHSEIMINENGTIKVVEIGGRMGGDCIGSSLVSLTTGIDFVHAVIDVALGQAPTLTVGKKHNAAGIKFVFSKEDAEYCNHICEKYPDMIVEKEVEEITDRIVVDSSSRFGYFIVAGEDPVLVRRIVEGDKSL
ncbi:ATP-grasp domain-containing protein [Butyrivibrio sp. CB08]|uniref:ATP-grasp domain-containing protein n=1 Tax=Butyrivibrio sp. CB08 TaxID=2364879 RepID=UPI000EA8F43D|nr:ATP-grasp domain-containing protein [Butyrivibrio sp. CB08]RKM57834.1 ATP-grasp domain-containing protein [Butyrivibrio sp. CB08]